MSPSGRTRWTLSLVTVAIIALIAVAIWLLRPAKITDRDLLLEAFENWQSAGSPSDGTDGQTFEQLATQGYYEEARSLMRPSRDFPYFVVKLAAIRSENGDVPGARGMLLGLGNGELARQATEAVALTQADAGDLTGALATIGPQGDRNKIIEQYGRHLIRAGELEGALKTQEQISDQHNWQLLYDVGDELRQRGEASRIPKLAATLHDPKMRSGFLKIATMMTREPSCSFDKNPACGCEVIQLRPDSCEYAAIFAGEGKFTQAWDIIDRKDCHIRSYVADKQYATDPVTAERELLKATDRLDLVTGLNELATQAAQKGNIPEAFRLAAKAAQTNGQYDRDVIRTIAREWTKRDNPRKVLKWARSLSTVQMRSWALIGMAEALGHARPHVGITGRFAYPT